MFAADSCLDKAMPRVETDFLVLSMWFLENFMKLNKGKYHLPAFATTQSNIKIKIGEVLLKKARKKNY